MTKEVSSRIRPMTAVLSKARVFLIDSLPSVNSRASFSLEVKAFPGVARELAKRGERKAV